jgi:ABC-type transport system substrate-binding protein
VIAWHLNIAHGPLANPLVRQAISLGVNRIEIANGLAGGYYEPSVLTIPAIFGQTQPAKTFDPVQARSLMRAAGYPDGITLKVYTSSAEIGGSGSKLLNFLYNEMIQIGVILQITYVGDSDQLLALEQNPGLESTIDTDAPLLGGAGFLLEENANAKLDPISHAVEQHYASPALQTLLDQLASSPGGSATRGLIGQAAGAIDTITPTINLIALPVQNVTRSNVTGYGAYTEPVTYYEYLHPRA